MKLSTVLIVILFLLSVCRTAQAEIYRCKDANGQTLVSDRPIQECVDRTIYVLKNSGQLQREIPASLTPEEQRQYNLLKEKQKNEELLELQRKKDAKYLKVHFKNETDIEQMRQRSLDDVNEKIRLGNEQIKTISQLIEQLSSEEEANKSSVELVILRSRKRQLTLSLEQSKSNIQAYEAEKIRLNNYYEETLRNYRETVQGKKK